MTTDWWSIHTTAETEEGSTAPKPDDSVVPPPPPEPDYVVTTEPDPGEEGVSNRARSMAVKVVSGVGGVLIVGALMLNASSGGGEGGAGSSTVPSAVRGNELPPAGGGNLQSDLPAAGGGPVPSQDEDAPVQRETQAPRTVTLTASSSGKGSVGSVMKISIRNDTEKTLTLMATLVRGDGKSGIVGEGTLAPGSRVVEPGEVVVGTVEFSSPTAPHQVALVDLSGNIVAASSES